MSNLSLSSDFFYHNLSVFVNVRRCDFDYYLRKIITDAAPDQERIVKLIVYQDDF